MYIGVVSSFSLLQIMFQWVSFISNFYKSSHVDKVTENYRYLFKYCSGYLLFWPATSTPSFSCNRIPFFLWEIAFPCSIWFWWGCKSEYPATSAMVISPTGEPVTQAELIIFRPLHFLQRLWEREDLSSSGGISLRHRNLKLSKPRLPLPHHLQGAHLEAEK